jgi:hypothetical protein
MPNQELWYLDLPLHPRDARVARMERTRIQRVRRRSRWRSLAAAARPSATSRPCDPAWKSSSCRRRPEKECPSLSTSSNADADVQLQLLQPKWSVFLVPLRESRAMGGAKMVPRARIAPSCHGLSTDSVYHSGGGVIAAFRSAGNV